MQIGMIGLGKMGMNMALRLMRGGHSVTGTAASEHSVAEAEVLGVIGARSVKELVGKLQAPGSVGDGASR